MFGPKQPYFSIAFKIAGVPPCGVDKFAWAQPANGIFGNAASYYREEFQCILGVLQSVDHSDAGIMEVVLRSFSCFFGGFLVRPAGRR